MMLRFVNEANQVLASDDNANVMPVIGHEFKNAGSNTIYEVQYIRWAETPTGAIVIRAFVAALHDEN